MSNQPKKPHNTPDPGLDLARRYSALTLAMQLATDQDNLADFEALLHERNRVLDDLELLDTLSPDAIREMNQGSRLGENLHDQVRAKQEATVTELVESFKGRKGRDAYRKQGQQASTEYRQVG